MKIRDSFPHFSSQRKIDKMEDSDGEQVLDPYELIDYAEYDDYDLTGLYDEYADSDSQELDLHVGDGLSESDEEEEVFMAKYMLNHQ